MRISASRSAGPPAALGAGTATATIAHVRPTVSITKDMTVMPGQTAEFNVALSPSPTVSYPISLEFYTQDGSGLNRRARNPQAGTDYVGSDGARTMWFFPGQALGQTISLPTMDVSSGDRGHTLKFNFCHWDLKMYRSEEGSVIFRDRKWLRRANTGIIRDMSSMQSRREDVTIAMAGSSPPEQPQGTADAAAQPSPESAAGSRSVEPHGRGRVTGRLAGQVRRLRLQNG